MVMGLNKWLILLTSGAIVGVAGFLFGQTQRKTDIQKLYQRTSFTLLDSKGEFFHSKEIGENQYLLLVYTPDELKQGDVIGIAKLYQDFKRNAATDLKLVFVSKVNRDLVADFLAAAGIRDRFLIDPSGSLRDIVRLNVNREAFEHWGYALVDRRMQLFWKSSQTKVMAFTEIRDQVLKSIDRSESLEKL